MDSSLRIFSASSGGSVSALSWQKLEGRVNFSFGSRRELMA